MYVGQTKQFLVQCCIVVSKLLVESEGCVPKIPVRLDQIVLWYAHNEWSSITSTGLSVIGLSCLTSQLENVQAEMLHMYMATKDIYIDALSSNTGSAFNTQFSFFFSTSVFADLGNWGHSAVQLLHMPLSMQASL